MAAMTTRRSARLSQASNIVNGSATPSKDAAPIARPRTPKETSDEALKQSRKRKSTSKDDQPASDPQTRPTSDTFAVPVTPDPKRRRTTTKKSLSTPPTSSIPSLSSNPPTLQPGTSHLARPAEPHATNAPLSTPNGSRVTAYSNTSPLKPTLPTPTSTTDTLLQDACAHLIRVSPRIAPIIEAHPCALFSPAGLREVIDPFAALSSSILGQQVSGAAAAAIKKRFVALFYPPERTNTSPTANGDSAAAAAEEEKEEEDKAAPEVPKGWFPSPAAVASKPIAETRLAGLSQRKAEYIQGLASKFSSGELSARSLVNSTDEELMTQLIAVRGLGQWSVEMFAMFALKRMDVFSTGDLGIQRGMAAFAGRDVGKLKNKGGKWKYMSEKEMVEMAEPYRPYRSLFCWYMWRVEDVDTKVFNDSI